MRLLALETSEYVSSVALWEDGRLAAEQTFESRMNLCATLAGRLGELLAPLGPEPALDGLAISLGPGSFTGLRVGVATAKALAHARGWPLVGVCTQEAIVAAADVPGGCQVLVVQPARRDHVYAGLWERTAAGATPVTDIQVVPTADLAAHLGQATAIVGTAVEAVLDSGVALPAGVALRTVWPAAAAVAALGAARLAQADPQAAFHLQPIYVLPSQAERQKELVVAAGTAPPEAARPVVQLRRGTLEDLPEVVRIERACFAAPWPEVSLRDELERAHGGVFIVAEVDGRLAGYVAAWFYAGEAHICNVAVDPPYRRQGLAEIMLLALISEARKAHCDIAMLEYRAGNVAGAGLYAKLGFQAIGVRRRYYQDNGEDAIVASIADLATAERQEALAELCRTWGTRQQRELRSDL